jgi:hypothetical protein
MVKTVKSLAAQTLKGEISIEKAKQVLLPNA